ncbi:YkvA family protein [Desulfovibrio sp. An276]|uniref:YkvA family protein n=1 Tax=Desulfovibrio sp. An276 TaxID=1965618 RepID=UPI0013A66A81|nr:YkvA family protein [Desulfovibrio sp. An276]
MAETIDYASNCADYADHYSEEALKAKLSKTRRLGRKLLKSVLELGYAFMSPDTPVWARAVIVGAIGYFISPADAVPDLVPGVGYVDDAAVIASALAAVGSNITDEVENKAEKAVDDLLG